AWPPSRLRTVAGNICLRTRRRARSGTIAPAKTMLTPISSVESWDAKSLSQSPKANSISARQNKFCTGNSTAEERSKYSSDNQGLTPALNECGALENTVALLAIPGEACGKAFYFA